MNLQDFFTVAGYGWMVIVVAVLVMLTVMLRIIRRPRYERQSHLITQTEARAFRFFEQQLKGVGVRIFAQVRIADVISVKGKRNRSWWRAFRKISSKHIDFVVTSQDFRLLAAIEVDDASHLKRERKERDVFVDRVFIEAGLPLIRVLPGKEQDGLPQLLALLKQ